MLETRNLEISSSQNTNGRVVKNIDLHIGIPKSIQNSEAIVILKRNLSKIVFFFMSFVMIGFYIGYQTHLYAETAPQKLVKDFVEAALDDNLAVLDNSQIFPDGEFSFITPEIFRNAVEIPTSGPKSIKVDWNYWSSTATVDFGDWGSPITLTSSDEWNYIFRKHNWSVQTKLPELQVIFTQNVVKKNPMLKIGKERVTVQELINMMPSIGSFPLRIGSLSIEVPGVGFLLPKTIEVDLRSGSENVLTIDFDGLGTPPRAKMLAQDAVLDVFDRCFEFEDCGKHSDEDFGIVIAEVAEYAYGIPSYDADECSLVTEEVLDTETGFMDWSCVGYDKMEIVEVYEYSDLYGPSAYASDFYEIRVQRDYRVKVQYSNQLKDFEVTSVNTK